jgi:hypothetical protein
MTGDTYPAARIVSRAVEQYFAQCRAAMPGFPEIAPAPDGQTIEQIATTGFWASLRQEEGRSPRISLAWVPPEQAGHPLRFARPFPLEPGLLARLAPAVERPGIHLGVWEHGGELCVWGTTRSIPPACFVLEVVQPGLLVIKRRRAREDGKFANVTVLHGDQVKMVDERGGDLPAGMLDTSPLLAFASTRSWTDSVNVVVQLALSMRTHGHGGSLLIVPRDSDEWRRSIVHPINYPAEPAFTGLSSLAAMEPNEEDRAEWMDAVRRAVDQVAGLTAVDGATIIDDRYHLLAFGAKIARSRGSAPVERVVVMEPVVGARPAEVDVSELGGTRHLSAAQFVRDQPDALALVASQDGRFTVFYRPPGQDTVHAHRVETLLL